VDRFFFWHTVYNYVVAAADRNSEL